jgi:hypothetical protein
VWGSHTGIRGFVHDAVQWCLRPELNQCSLRPEVRNQRCLRHEVRNQRCLRPELNQWCLRPEAESAVSQAWCQESAVFQAWSLISGVSGMKSGISGVSGLKLNQQCLRPEAESAVSQTGSWISGVSGRKLNQRCLRPEPESVVSQAGNWFSGVSGRRAESAVSQARGLNLQCVSGRKLKIKQRCLRPEAEWAVGQLVLVPSGRSSRRWEIIEMILALKKTDSLCGWFAEKEKWSKKSCATVPLKCKFDICSSNENSVLFSYKSFPSFQSIFSGLLTFAIFNIKEHIIIFAI